MIKKLVFLTIAFVIGLQSVQAMNNPRQCSGKKPPLAPRSTDAAPLSLTALRTAKKRRALEKALNKEIQATVARNLGLENLDRPLKTQKPGSEMARVEGRTRNGQSTTQDNVLEKKPPLAPCSTDAAPLSLTALRTAEKPRDLERSIK